MSSDTRRRPKESNGRWGLDSDSLQGDEQRYQGWSVEGLQNMKEDGGMEEACRQVVYIQISGNLGFCFI